MRLLNVSISLVLALSVTAHAELKPMNDEALSSQTGQAILYDPSATSIKIGLDARYNLEENRTKICDPSAGEVACNIGIASNNRYTSTDPATAAKYWLVLKNVTGAITVPEIKMSAQDVDVSAPGDSPDIRSSLALTFNYNNTPAKRDDPESTTKWIKLEKFGFESLAVEADSDVEVLPDGSLNTANLPGYRNPALAPTSDPANPNVFDDGKFRGFIGLDVTADIAINGVAKVFSCSSGSSYRC